MWGTNAAPPSGELSSLSETEGAQKVSPQIPPVTNKMPKFETKAEARAFFREKRAALDPQIKANIDSDITSRLRALPEYKAADIILCYYPIKGEIDMRALIRHAVAEGKAVALPVCRDGEMTFHLYTGSFVEGAFGIPEPTGERIEPTGDTLCILPGYAYCGHHRLGYGGGYYDRFLENFKGRTVFACYSFFTAEFPIEEHDKPYDILITEGNS